MEENVKKPYEQRYPYAAELMTSDEFEGVVDIFRTLLTWKQEAEADKGGKQWTVSSSIESRTESKKKDLA